MSRNPALDALRHHVSGAIARGTAVAITELPVKLKASNIKWHYPDARGVWHSGEMQGFSDFGGTDVPYRFKNDDDGHLTVRRLSSADCKAAHRVWNGRPHPNCPLCKA